MFRKFFSKVRGANSKSISNETLFTEEKSENLDQTLTVTSGENVDDDGNVKLLVENENTNDCVVESTGSTTQVLQCSVTGGLETILPLEGQSMDTSGMNHKDSITENTEEKTHNTEYNLSQELDDSDPSNVESGDIPEENTETDKTESYQLYCRPCQETNESRYAEIWCTICHESLCGNCNSHHAVFKATRNHTVINMEEYKDIITLLKDTSHVCPYHPEILMDNFCVQHNQTICYSCQINNHQGCETKQIDQMIGVSQHMIEFDQSFEKMNNCIRFLTEMSENRSSAKESLLNMRERFVDDLKVNRRAIDDWLDKVENEARMQFENIYIFEKEKMEKQGHQMEKVRSEIQKRLEIGNKLAPFKAIPTTQMLFAILEITNYARMEYGNLMEQQNSFYNVSIDGNISFEVTEPEKTIKINNNFQFIHDFCNIRIDDNDRDETPFDQLSDKQGEEKHHKPYVKKDEKQMETKDDVPAVQTDDKQVKKEDDDEVHTSSSGAVEECHSTSMSTSMYQLRHSFYVQKSISKIELLDVLILPTGELAILESSTPRLLVYTKDGNRKRGQVPLWSTPGCLTMYRNEDVAVTLPELQKIAIIDTWSLTLESYIKVYDECHGVCLANDQLAVNCVNHGLKLIDGYGTIRRVIPQLKGRLYICNGGVGNVFTLKEGSKMVVRYNINNNRRSDFHVGLNYKPRGIAVDRYGNLLFTCNESDGIYRKEDATMSSEIMISEGIRDPSRITYDKQ